MIILLLIFGLSTAIFSFSQPTEAAPGIFKQINFQGKLTDNNGNIVGDGTYSMRFRFYNHATNDAAAACAANSCLWEETQATVAVTAGLFSVKLGSVTSLGTFDFNQDTLYLGVKVGADLEMTPRYRLSAVPQAFTADNVQGAVPGVSANNILKLDSSGHISIAGNIQTTAGQFQGSTYTGSGAVTLSSGGAGALTLDSASGVLQIAAADTTLQRTAAGTYTIDLKDTGNTTLAVTNSDTGIASVQIEAGGSYTGAGAVTLSSGGAGALTLDSASNTLVIASSDTALQRAAAGTLAIQLNDTADTTLSLTNTDGTAKANLSVEGTVGVGTLGASGGSSLCLNGGVIAGCSSNPDSVTLQQAYASSSSPATITTTSAAKDVVFKSGSGFNSSGVFQVQDAGSAEIFAVDTTDSNIVANGSFELDTTGWAYFGTPGSVGRVTAEKHLGRASLQVTTTANADNGARYTTGTALAVSSTYTISWYAKRDATAFSDIMASYDRDGSGGGADANCTGINTQVVSNSGWTRFSCQIVTDATTPAADAYVTIKQDTTATARTFYIDAVQIESGSAASAYREGGVFLNGVVTSPVALRNAADSTTALQVQNAAGSNLLQVNTLNAEVTITGGTSGTASALTVSNSTSTGNILTLKDDTVTVGQVLDGGIYWLQPTALGSNGVGFIVQTTVAAAATGIIAGSSLEIDASGASTAGVGNIALRVTNSDTGSAQHENVGIKVDATGTNTAMGAYGIDARASRGIGIRGQAISAAGDFSVGEFLFCGNLLTGLNSIGVCGESTVSAAAAYTAYGVYGAARGGTGATSYGGYFTINSASTATATALVASNSSVTGNILLLQDGTTPVLTVGDGGSVSVTPIGNNVGTTIKQTSGTATSGNVFAVQTQNGASNFIEITNAAANEGAVTIQSVGATRGLTLQSATGTVSLGSSTGLTANGGLAISSSGSGDLTLTSAGSGGRVVVSGASGERLTFGSSGNTPSSIAKRMTVTAAVNANEVVVIDTATAGQVTTTTTADSTRVFGIATTTNGVGVAQDIVMGGVFQVEVTPADGIAGNNVAVGDFLTTSTTAGRAKVNNSPVTGTVLGRALSTDDANDLVWVYVTPGAGGADGAGSGANTALSNLSAVAINTSLLPGADNTIDVGDGTTKSFRTGYFETSVLSALFDTIGASTLSVGTGNATAVTISKSGVTATVQGALTVSELLTANGNVTFSDGAAGDTITIGDSLVATQDTVNIQGDINIGTDTDADTIVIGDTGNADTFSLNSTGLRISTAGSLTNVGTNITGAGALNVASAGANNLTLTSGSGTISLAGSTLQRTAAGTTTIDLNDASNTTFSVTNSGAGVASISLAEAGSYTGAGAVTLSSGGAGALSLDSASGTIELLDTTDLNNNTLQGGTAAIDFTNFDVTSTGEISTGADLIFTGAGNVSRTIRKSMIPSAVNANDVVIIDTVTAGRVTTTTSAASNKVFGIATANAPGGSAQDIVTGGVYQVNATGTVNIGDFLVTATSAGLVAASADPAAGTVLGRALSAQASGTGLVWVYVTPGIGGGGGGSGANTALSNLSAVAINTSLLPGADNTIDVGDGTTKSFRTGYFDTSVLTALLDTVTASALQVGTTNATAINLNQNTAIAATKTLTVTSGLTSLTGNTTGDALNVSNSSSTGNIAVFSDAATPIFTIADGGFITLQPTANFADSGSHVTQTLTNATSAASKTVNGLNQSITVANTVTNTTTNGINITVTDNTGAGLFQNANTGVKITMQGTADFQLQTGIDSSANRGIGIRGTSTGAGSTNTNCGSVTGALSVGVCGTSAAGIANSYGGVFTSTASSGGAALLASNVTGTNNILQLQDATGGAANVLVVGDGGSILVTPKGNNVGATFRQTSGTATSGSVIDVTTADGTGHFIQVTNTAANEGSLGLASIGSNDISLNSGSDKVKLASGDSLVLSGQGNAVASIMKNMVVTSAVNAYDVVIIDTSNAGQVTPTTSSASNKVFGIATTTNAGAGVAQDIVTSGVYEVNADGGVSIGDFLVTDTASGHVVSSATPAAGTVLGRALSSKIAGDGRVWVYVTPGIGGASAGGGTLQSAYTASSDPEILLSSTIGGISLQDGAVAVSGNLFEVQNNARTTTYLGISATQMTLNATLLQKSDSATAFQIQDTANNNALVFDASSSVLRVYENIASPTAHAQIYYASGEAVFAASTGTTRVGSGSGNITMSVTGVPDVFTFTKTATIAGAYSSSDFSVTRQLTGNFAQTGAVLKVEDNSTSTPASNIAPNVLLVNQANTGAAGNLILAQTGGVNDKFTVSVAGTVTIAASQSYTGAGSVTYTSNGTTLVTAAAGNAVNITANNSSTWQTTTGTLTLQTASGSALILGSNVATVQRAATALSIDLATAASSTLTVTNSDASNVASLAVEGDISVGSGRQVSSAGALTIQGGGALIIDTAAASTIRIGDGTNNVTFAATTRKITFNGSARQTRRVTLVPEYPGAVLTGDGTGNTGTMTSDFCSATGRRNINAASCPTAGDEHNYYNWTHTAAGDYDVWVQYQIPSDFNAFSSDTSINMFGWRTDATATTEVRLYMFQANGTECGTAGGTVVATGTAVWTETPLGGSETGCTVAAGDKVLFRIHMEVAANKVVKAGEIRFDYLSSF